MANRRNPLDYLEEDMYGFASDLTRHFLAGDDEIDPEEHALLTRIFHKYRRITHINSKRRFIEHIERGDRVTPYTQHLAEAAGLRVEGVEEPPDNVIPFPVHPRHAG